MSFQQTFPELALYLVAAAEAFRDIMGPKKVGEVFITSLRRQFHRVTGHDFSN